ncbi:MAG: DUF1990 domain-containing protein [Bryobacteraceae bacterium]
MFLLNKPTRERICAFIASQRSAQFSYPEQGATRDRAPRGYTVDRNRIQLGRGAAAFAQAVVAVRQWKMFDTGWIDLCWPEAPIQEGSTVAVLARHYGFWSLNASRVVYVVDDRGAHSKYGFAYGTLAEHAETGEERFTVELRPEDETVWYEIYAFSRPNGLARVGYPLSRRLQKQFARDSKAAMLRAAGFWLSA